MSDRERLERRLRTVERTLTGDDHDLEAVVGHELVETLEERLADAEERVDELEAANQALRGYVGNVRSVNEDVEQRAEAALAAVDRLEERLDTRDPPRSTDAGEGVRSDGRASTPADHGQRRGDPRPAAAGPDQRRSPTPTDRPDRDHDDARDERDAEGRGVLDRLRARL